MSPTFRVVMLPPEPGRSRASELKAEVRIPAKESFESKDAQVALDALLSARKMRKQSEADQQRLCRQRLRWEKVCEEALNMSNSNQEDPMQTGAATFWQRHAFGRLSRRTPLPPASPSSRKPVPNKSCREMFRRAPAHTTDAVKAVLAERTPKAAQSSNEQAQEFHNFIELEGSFDWSSPYTLAYNSASADLARQEKWEQSRSRHTQTERIERTEMTYGYDEEDVKLMKSSQRLEHEAGGGLGIARRILALKEQGAPWQEFLPLAPRAQTTSFEIPKELALQLAIVFAGISKGAESCSESESKETTSIRTPRTPIGSIESSESLRSGADLLVFTAMSLMSSAAARARDSDSCEFPLEGLEAIAQSGLGWRAFSNMFLAALYAQLQREASERGSCIVLSKELALRVASVFTWASNADMDLYVNVSPAGRRVVQAAHNALLDQNLSTAILELLKMLAVRDTGIAR